MAVFLITQPSLFAQTSEFDISEKKVYEILNTLASDSMRGRGNGTPEILKAARFIGTKFHELGLKPLPDMSGYFLSFPITEQKHTVNNTKLIWNGVELASDSFQKNGFNVVARLTGKSKPDEIIIFSAHYDHVGIGRNKKDSIWNGANDNASGSTALLLLAEYFAKRNDNDRTLIFCAFAGEEIGLFGSKDFSNHLKSEKIIAGINLEMLGVSQYGRKKVFITGFEKTTLGNHLAKQLRKAGLKLVDEPDPEGKMLFYRSDNYPFAKKGVPFLTIMASDDGERCYHQPCDELQRIDLPNMISIIQSIAIACGPLIKGEYTPSRINSENLDSRW